MEFAELVKQRYSVRAYRANPVEEEKLEQVLEAARLAPTAGNRQPFRVLVIHTKGRQEELARIYGREWFLQAPFIIGVYALPAEAWSRADGKSYADVDASIVMDHLILAAASLGLGTCWIGAFDPAAARQVLGIPEEIEPIAFTPLGYPADQAQPKKRKPLSDLVRYERW